MYSVSHTRFDGTRFAKFEALYALIKLEVTVHFVTSILIGQYSTKWPFRVRYPMESSDITKVFFKASFLCWIIVNQRPSTAGFLKLELNFSWKDGIYWPRYSNSSAILGY